MTKKQLKEENKVLITCIKELSTAIRQYNSPPEGCKRGGWCFSCAYGQEAKRGYYTSPLVTVECCYGACENFAPREK